MALRWRPLMSERGAQRYARPPMTPMVLRCTAKVLKVLGPDALEAAGSPIAPRDDDWYMNLLWLDGRKCLLVTHAGTKFSAFAPNVRVAALPPSEVSRPDSSNTSSTRRAFRLTRLVSSIPPTF